MTRTLNISNALTIGESGILSFSGVGSTVNAASGSNAGLLLLQNGATVNITGDFDNINDVTIYSGGPVVNVGGTLTNEPGAQFYDQGSFPKR